MIADITATSATLFRIAIGTFITIIYVAACAGTGLCIALGSQVMIINVAATASALFCVAIGTLVKIIDIAARASPCLCITLSTQVTIINVATTSAAFYGIAIRTFVMIIYVAATGKRIPAENHQHCKNQFHSTLPWVSQETAWH